MSESGRYDEKGTGKNKLVAFTKEGVFHYLH
jgi:hypothetical protein